MVSNTAMGSLLPDSISATSRSRPFSVRFFERSTVKTAASLLDDVTFHLVYAKAVVAGAGELTVNTQANHGKNPYVAVSERCVRACCAAEES